MARVLKVSDQLHDAMKAERLEPYFARAKQYARKHFAQSLGGLSDPELDQAVRGLQKLAADHGVRSEYGYISWLFLAGFMGPNFHELPDIKHALASTSNKDQFLKSVMDRVEAAGGSGG